MGVDNGSHSPPESLKDLLGDLQTQTIKLLLARIKDGTAAPADLSVARSILRDNNIQVLPQANPDLLRLAGNIPFPGAESA
jgi:hypothetical protein